MKLSLEKITLKSFNYYQLSFLNMTLLIIR